MKTLAFLLLAPAQAGAFTLTFPVDCTLNQTCFIQQFNDRDPTPNATDFTCGPLSYDGHKGTDFAVPTLQDMANGVAVLAAAPGQVRAIRDDMDDIASNAPNAPDISNRECGNAVVITHDGSWKTQYCHLKRGSVTVKPGQTVTPGTPLGQIGLSGNTEFPHLHLSVRQNGQVIDPFSPGDTATCNAPAPGLWSPALPYQPGGLIDAGFASAVPSFDAVKSGTAAAPSLPKTAPALVIWTHIFGPRAGDTLTFTLTGPKGRILQETLNIDRTQARAMRAVGKRLRAAAWPPGTYTGSATLTRANQMIGDKRVTLNIAP
ncbi:Peptidase family M23 [Pseudorhodobacter antarcticus]|uniref:Peptidase family M23 n=1 Tax=Pseudorhodobacter antarcticus TaxID=1077947 RepID=A0A1H8FVA9_9RHOB|nr:M23 family metallopeptidase [Pseudorhodobacter antarcticus]SEN35656.1 Peptidase family M23 [Pseudorhodobacter antarcticus]